MDAKNMDEQAKSLISENKRLENQAALERIDFALQLTGCYNVKASRAKLGDYYGNGEMALTVSTVDKSTSSSR